MIVFQMRVNYLTIIRKWFKIDVHAMRSFPMDFGVLIGWPAIIGALLFLFIGLIRKQSYWLIFGTVLSFPFTFYLSGTPRFGISIYILTLSLIGSIFAMRKQMIWLSWLLVLPFIIFIIWLVFELYIK